jgi:hypothetical protein
MTYFSTNIILLFDLMHHWPNPKKLGMYPCTALDRRKYE